jgi:hypothetical protein
MTAMTATYTKLKSGDWGLRIIGAEPATGATITVATKSGAAKTEVVGRILWSGPDRETGAMVHLCAIGSAQVQSPVATRRRKSCREEREEEADFAEDMGHYRTAERIRSGRYGRHRR